MALFVSFGDCHREILKACEESIRRGFHLITSSRLFAQIPESDLRSLIPMIETEKRDYCRTPNRTRTSPNHDPRRMIQAFVTWNGRSEKVGTLGTLRILVTDGSTGSGQPRKI